MNYSKIGVAFCVVFSCLSVSVNAQNANERNVKSTVFNDNGLPVSGAVVANSKGNAVATTDAAGQFAVTVPDNALLVITASGFQSHRVKVDTVPEKIMLQNEATQPVNVVFKQIYKQDLPGAISVLEPETYIDRDYNLGVEAGINGRVAGLLGTSSIWGMENALVLIDGVRRDFSDITLNEVQQITVLKGVNAVALYGSQAAKGVILVTSKKGEAGTRKVAVRVNTGIATPKALPTYLGSADYMKLYNEARRNDGLPDLYDATTIQNYSTGNSYRFPSVDYYSSAYLKKHQNATDANAEFSGGNNIARFYSNVGWANSSTLLNVGEGKNEGDNRFNVRGNIDLKLNDYITSSVNVSAIFNDSRRGRGNYWGNAATLLPNKFTTLIPLNMISPDNASAAAFIKASRNLIDGQYLLGGSQQFPTNPLADLYVGGYDKFIRRTFQVTNNVDVNLNNLLQGLSFHTLFNIDYRNSYIQSINNSYAVYFPTWSTTADSVSGLQKFGTDSRPGTQNISGTAQMQNIGFSSWLNYDKTVKEVHNFSATLLGHTSSIK
ncbi:MAG TPA: TonB-dependent receptor plug domain-containing protein, partial [Flavisolibacter sp.]|nr:TonB-dependent receptor plug domain-containing protein [Flavisolibacter sp.]